MDQSVNVDGLHLTISLFKSGCRWDGDVFSKKWAEYLVIPDDVVQERAERDVMSYMEGADYKWELHDGKKIGIWVR